MPLEHAGWCGPNGARRPVRVATLRLPVPSRSTPRTSAPCRPLRFNPWHALPEHRPLGNQNRARRTIYATVADVRQRMNATPHVEPTDSDWLRAER